MTSRVQVPVVPRPSQAARSSISARTAAVVTWGRGGGSLNRVDDERAGLAVGGRVDVTDEQVAVTDVKGATAPEALGLEPSHLEEVLEAEELLGAARSWMRRSGKETLVAKPVGPE